MAEYQYYEFLAIDRPLDARQLAELRALSTRARISPSRFVNTYQWGDFRGDPRALMTQYFDAFLYTANWGARRLMLRLPSRLLDPSTARRYCHTDSASTWAAGKIVILDLCREDQDGSWEDEEYGEESLGSIIPARGTRHGRSALAVSGMAAVGRIGRACRRRCRAADPAGDTGAERAAAQRGRLSPPRRGPDCGRGRS